MSPPGRPEGEYRGAQREGAPATAAEDCREVVERLREMAVVLDEQAGNPFRTAACRRAADLLVQGRHGRPRRIAPRRFNPAGEAWLPVLHTTRGDWQFTALYSNTARAHELGGVHDWVVVNCEDADHGSRQYNVVTPAGAPLAGRRVVRGRESECQAWYAARATASGSPADTERLPIGSCRC